MAYLNQVHNSRLCRNRRCYNTSGRECWQWASTGDATRASQWSLPPQPQHTVILPQQQRILPTHHQWLLPLPQICNQNRVQVPPHFQAQVSPSLLGSAPPLRFGLLVKSVDCPVKNKGFWSAPLTKPPVLQQTIL